MNDSATPSVRSTSQEISLAIAGALGVIALAFAVAFFLEKRDITWLDIATALHGNRNPFGALMRGCCVIAGAALLVWAWRRIGRERIAPRLLRHTIALFAPLALVPFALFLPREWGQGGVLAGLISLAAYRFLRDSRRTPSDLAAEPSVIQAPRPPNRIPRPERISAVVVTLFAVLFIALNIKRIAGFEPWYDHALFMDVAKRTVGGEPFASAFVGPNILSHHFMPILFPISILKIGFPLLWIPFRAGAWSLALLVIGLHLLSGYGFQQRLGGHYFLLAAPVIWFCLVLSLRKHYALRAVSTLRNVSMAAVVGIVAWNLFEPWTVYPPTRPPGEVAAIKKLLAGIPDDSKVAADPRYLPYLYARTRAVPRWFVDGAELARGVVDYVAIDHSDRVSQETESAALIDRLKATRNFEVVVDEGNHNLLRYRGP